MKNKKISVLQMLLTMLFVICLVISNIITGKQVQLPFNIVMTAAVVIFPITYILSDVFSEVYGYKWSRFTCYLGFAANLLAVSVFSIVIATPAPDYWTNQAAFEAVLGNTPRVLGASLLAFLLAILSMTECSELSKKSILTITRALVSVRSCPAFAVNWLIA